MFSLFPSRTVAFEIFGFGVHWYGLMYLTAFIVAWFLLPRLQKYRGLALSADDWSNVVSAAVVGVVVGGRLGYVLFYGLPYFLAEPWKVFAVWEGGMSFHGGLIGATLAIMFMLRKRPQDWLRFADIIVIPAALGLAFGRVGNFINGELYGPITTLPWGMTFPGVEGVRHPTQLYACAKDLFIATMCFLHVRRPGSVTGRTAALFLMLYGVLRFLVEYLRVQEYPVLDLGLFTLTRGQQLTIPVFLLGCLLWWFAGKISRTSGGAMGTGRA